MESYNRIPEIFDYSAKSYKQHEYKEISDVDTYSFLKDERLDFKNKVVIDVGCGLGECSAWFLMKDAKIVISIDPSHVSLLEARKYILKKTKGKKALPVRSKTPDLPFPDNSFDLVLAHGMMSYVDDFNETLLSLKRIVKKNGQIIVSFVEKKKFDPILDMIRIPCSKIPVRISRFIANILGILFYPFAPLFIKKKPSLKEGYTLDRTFFEMFFVDNYKTANKNTIIKMLNEIGMKITELEHPKRPTNFVLLLQK